MLVFQPSSEGWRDPQRPWSQEHFRIRGSQDATLCGERNKNSNVFMVPISQMGNWKWMTNIPRVLEACTGALAGWRRSPGRVAQEPWLVAQEPRPGGAEAQAGWH